MAISLKDLRDFVDKQQKEDAAKERERLQPLAKKLDTMIEKMLCSRGAASLQELENGKKIDLVITDKSIVRQSLRDLEIACDIIKPDWLECGFILYIASNNLCPYPEEGCGPTITFLLVLDSKTK
jgi:hypothetical protein